MVKEINIIGYSGHSYVCIETALLNDIAVVGYFDTVKKNKNFPEHLLNNSLRLKKLIESFKFYPFFQLILK